MTVLKIGRKGRLLYSQPGKQVRGKNIRKGTGRAIIREIGSDLAEFMDL